MPPKPKLPKPKLKMSEPIECPICMDCIGDKNCITTECGHKFHAKCMFTNIDRNGFSCPCCRSIMIEEVEDEEDTDDDGTNSIFTETVDSFEADEPFSDDALRGLRLLTNLLEGEEQDQADVVAEFQYNEEHLRMRAVPREEVERQFREDGVTYGQLLAWILNDHEEYEEQQAELEELSGDLWFKIRRMITDYNLVDHGEESVDVEEVEDDEEEAQDDEEEAQLDEQEVDVDEEEAQDDESAETDYSIVFRDGGGFFLEETDIAMEDLELLRADLSELFDMEMSQPICV